MSDLLSQSFSEDSSSNSEAAETLTVHPTRVFVGGLAKGTTELDIETFFSDFGEVEDVRIKCDRKTGEKWYGFVTYSRKEPSDMLIDKGTVRFKGRVLRLRRAVRKKTAGGQLSGDQTGYWTSTSVPGQWVLMPATNVYVSAPQQPVQSSLHAYSCDQYYPVEETSQQYGYGSFHYQAEPAPQPVYFYLSARTGTTYYMQM